MNCAKRCVAISLDEERPMQATERQSCLGFNDGEKGSCTLKIHIGMDDAKSMILPTRTKLVAPTEHVPTSMVAVGRPRAFGSAKGVYGGGNLRRRLLGDGEGDAHRNWKAPLFTNTMRQPHMVPRGGLEQAKAKDVMDTNKEAQQQGPVDKVSAVSAGAAGGMDGGHRFRTKGDDHGAAEEDAEVAPQTDRRKWKAPLLLNGMRQPHIVPRGALAKEKSKDEREAEKAAQEQGQQQEPPREATDKGVAAS